MDAPHDDRFLITYPNLMWFLPLPYISSCICTHRIESPPPSLSSGLKITCNKESTFSDETRTTRAGDLVQYFGSYLGNQTDTVFCRYDPTAMRDKYYR